MLRRIAPMQDLKRATSSIRDPEKWTERDLRSSSLAHLSRTLSQNLTTKRILTVYFNWLEAHRRQETEPIEDWGETIVNWILDLRTRGFGKEELILQLRAYKEINGISDTPIYLSSGQRRCFPMVYDINKAWAGAYPGAENQEYYWSGSGKFVQASAKKKQYHTQENFDGIPPGSYVCNRCHKPGHFLEVCPTNLDPSFDKPPGQDYKCPICYQWGIHYKSICPENQDKLSINQKRLKANVDRTSLKPSRRSSGAEMILACQKKINQNENNVLLRGRPIIDRSRSSDDSAHHTTFNGHHNEGLLNFSADDEDPEYPRREIEGPLREDDASYHMSPDGYSGQRAMAKLGRSSGKTTYHASNEYLSKRRMDYSPDGCFSKERRSLSAEYPQREIALPLRDATNYHTSLNENFHQDRISFSKYEDPTYDHLETGGLESERPKGTDSYHTSPKGQFSQERNDWSEYGRSDGEDHQIEHIQRPTVNPKQLQAIENMETAIDSIEAFQSSDTLMMAYDSNKVHNGRAAEKRYRPLSPDAKYIQERRDLNDKSPSPTKEEALRFRLALIDEYEYKSSRGTNLSWKERAMVTKKAMYEARLRRMEDMSIMDQEIESHLLKKLADPYRSAGPVPKRRKLSATPPDSTHHINMGMTIGLDINSDVEKTPKIISHVDFMKKLIGRFPELTKKINPVRRAKSAAVMWDADAERFYRLSESPQASDRLDVNMEDEEVEGGYGQDSLDRLNESSENRILSFC